VQGGYDPWNASTFGSLRYLEYFRRPHVQHFRDLAHLGDLPAPRGEKSYRTATFSVDSTVGNVNLTELPAGARRPES